jgi:hypothetical protein
VDSCGEVAEGRDDRAGAEDFPRCGTAVRRD